MNLISFTDELIKLGAGRTLLKRASEIDASSSTNSAEPPAGMMGGGAIPPALRIVPERSATRLPLAVDHESQIEPGALGGVTSAKAPIDRDKFNRWYRDKR